MANNGETGMANGRENSEPLPGPPPDSSYSRSDTRCVPLTLALLATNFRHPDPGNVLNIICIQNGASINFK